MATSQPIDIIMFAMSHYTDWQKGQVNRNYHVVRQLEQDERIGKIVMVDFLPFSWRKAAKVYGENILTGLTGGELIYGDLTSTCHQVSSKLYVYSTIDSIYSQKTVIKELRRVVRYLALQRIAFWSFNPLFTLSLKELGRRLPGRELFIFDAVDNWLEHPAFTRQRQRLTEGYQMVNRDADVIFTVSAKLRDTLFSDNTRAQWIPNGIDLDHFARPVSWPVPADLKRLARPIIGYHGVIEGRVNLDLVAGLAARRPDWSLVLIGAGIWRHHRRLIAKKLGGLSNVHLIPFIPYKDLPPYLWSCDATIVPHYQTPFTESMNPMKLYEYMAAGCPVVTTPVAGAATFGNLLHVATDAAGFEQAIQQALDEDGPVKRQQRLEAVADDSWHGRVELMMRLIEERWS